MTRMKWNRRKEYASFDPKKTKYEKVTAADLGTSVTEKQLDFMRSLGMPEPKGYLSKKAASILITAYLESVAERKMGRPSGI